MYIGFFSYYRIYNKNRMLTDSSSLIGDNLMYPFVLLAQKLKEQGHKVATIDTDDLKKFDAVIFVEFPGLKNKYLKKLIKNGFKNLYLILFESPVIKPDNYNTENHKYFKKIFTWADDLVNNKKYFKINYSHKIPENLDFDASKNKKLCCVISGHKYIHNSLELYTERVKAIRWFEKNAPQDFDLYGIGWDKFYFYGKFLGFNLLRFNRLKLLAKIIGPKYPSWRGDVKSKNETYKNYKFSICYENCKDFKGYITEKIFDCFLAGCVPIYWGANNIKDHIPENCFIDKNKFSTYEGLYKYIKNMPEKEYFNYVDSIANFLKSEKAYPFSAEYFADIIIKEIT